jgi:hypothetical protein
MAPACTETGTAWAVWADVRRSRAPQPGQIMNPAGSGFVSIPAWQRGHFIAGPSGSPKWRGAEDTSIARPGDLPYIRRVALTRAGVSDTAARLFGGAPERIRALLVAAWPLAVGPELSRRTEVLGIERGTLRIRVPDARWRTVLHGMQPEILQRLRLIAGSLAPWRIGYVEGGMKDAGPLPAPGLPGAPAALPAEVSVPAAGIADEEIRRRFVDTAARSLARRRQA